MSLNERQRFALTWLAERTSPGLPLYGGNGAAACLLGDAMVKAGLLTSGNGHKRHGASQGAANVLVSLKRRGLATNSTPGGEAFQAVEWGVTEAGMTFAMGIEARP